MKTLMKSFLVVVGASAASAHHHGQYRAVATGKSSAPSLAPSTTTIAPSTAFFDSSTTSRSDNTTSVAVTTRPSVPVPLSPVLKAIADVSEAQQMDEVTDAFYQLLNSGHVQAYDYTPVKADEGSPIKYNGKYDKYNDKYNGKYNKYNDKYNKYNHYDDKECLNCNEEKRYRDFDYEYKEDGGSSQVCYALQRSDEGYAQCDFVDISGTGTALTNFTNGATTINLETSFEFFDRELVDPQVQIFVNGFVSFSVIDPLTLSGNTLPNPSEGPYDMLAPFYQAQTLSNSGGYLANPAVYFQTDNDKTIIQWETNEDQSSSYSAVTDAGAIYQLHIESSGRIAFSYKLATCDIPNWTTVQVGVKPLETELASGYKTSFFQSACQGGGYYAPCPGTSVTLKRVKCNSLIGQTGIKKPKVQKKYYYKESNKKNYDSKKEHYVDFFHQKAQHIYDHYHH